LTKKIAEIGNKIIKASDKPDMNCTFRILNNPTINAYSTASGEGSFIYVNTGLLDIIESEDELAGVLAHEIAHAVKKHQIKFLKSEFWTVAGTRMFLEFTAEVIRARLGPTLAPYPRPLTQFYTEKIRPVIHYITRFLGSNTVAPIIVTIMQGYGKEQKLEADALAIRYMAKAGYQPTAYIAFLKKLKSIRDKLKINEKNYASCLINAKPGLEKRIKYVEKLISELEYKRNNMKNKKLLTLILMSVIIGLFNYGFAKKQLLKNQLFMKKLIGCIFINKKLLLCLSGFGHKVQAIHQQFI